MASTLFPRRDRSEHASEVAIDIDTWRTEDANRPQHQALEEAG